MFYGNSFPPVSSPIWKVFKTYKTSLNTAKEWKVTRLFCCHFASKCHIHNAAAQQWYCLYRPYTLLWKYRTFNILCNNPCNYPLCILAPLRLYFWMTYVGSPLYLRYFMLLWVLLLVLLHWNMLQCYCSHRVTKMYVYLKTQGMDKLFQLLPSGKRYRALYAKTSRHRGSFFPQAVALMNNQ